MATTTVESPVGKLTLTGRGGYLTGLHMDGQRHIPDFSDQSERDDSVFTEVVRQLDAYFAGTLTRFDLPIRLEGTEFQRSVWAALAAIAYGHTVSYGELAAQVGDPNASRAVGSANARNPIAIVIPCHRVIAAHGSIGGYGGGLDRKQWLLAHENFNAVGS